MQGSAIGPLAVLALLRDFCCKPLTVKLSAAEPWRLDSHAFHATPSASILCAFGDRWIQRHSVFTSKKSNVSACCFRGKAIC